MHSDPVADMLTRIRNAVLAGHTSVVVPNSSIKLDVAKILKEEGYIEDFTVGDEEPTPIINVTLKYWGKRRERRSVITTLERISKPGRRVYVGTHNIPWVLSGMGTAILSTSQGVMTGQQARRRGIGGEVLCYIY
ncbi:MAG: 30S ribosomal protein S8 [Anaerolineae bacterium]|nr:30S ribosomal protein S8 [Anaerolineae bacterium]